LVKVLNADIFLKMPCGLFERDLFKIKERKGYVCWNEYRLRKTWFTA